MIELGKELGQLRSALPSKEVLLMQRKGEDLGERKIFECEIAVEDLPSMEGDIFVGASKGRGKTNTIEGFTQQHTQAGYKCFSLDWYRRENIYFGFPETDPILTQKIYEAGREPQGFKSKVFIPFVVEAPDIPLKIPENWLPFKIPFDSLSVEDFTAFMPNSSEITASLFEAILREPSVKSLGDLLTLVSELVAEDAFLEIDCRGKTVSIGGMQTFKAIARYLTGMYKTNLISSKKGHTVNVLKRMKASKTIDCFTTYNTGDRWKTNIYTWLHRQQWLQRLKHPGLAPLFRQIPEYQMFAPADPKLNPYAMGWRSSLALELKWLTQGRDIGGRTCADSQSIDQVDMLAFEKFNIFYIGGQQRESLKKFFERTGANTEDYTVFEHIPKYPKGRWLKTHAGAGYGQFRVDLDTVPSMSFHKRANRPTYEVYEQEGIVLKEWFDELPEDVKYVISRNLTAKQSEEIEGSDEFASL